MQRQGGAGVVRQERQVRRRGRFIKPRTYPHKEQLTQGWQGASGESSVRLRRDIVDGNKRLGRVETPALSLGFLAQ